MAKVQVLIEGYAKKIGNGWVASSTTCLITSGDKKIISDPGCNRKKLLGALQDVGLETKDIDFVFLSHCHPDHILLAGIFDRAKYITFDANLAYQNDLMAEFDPHVLGDDVEIIDTPGHVLEHISLLIQTPEGKIGIAGDVIWWLDDEKQVFDIEQNDHSQAKGLNMDELIKSRKRLVDSVDYIIPGHGRMFQVKK